MASSSGRQDPDLCPICLEAVKQEAYLDCCFHLFCYPCIAHWSKVITKKHPQMSSSIKCPLCKTENFSILHGFNGESFQRRYIKQGQQKSPLSSAHEFRLQWYNSVVRIPWNIFDVQQYWKSCRYLRRNSWLQSWLTRELQALNQEEDVDVIVHHIHGSIESFLERQEQQNRMAARHEEKREEFRKLLYGAARPFVLARTERFVDEVEMFLVSGLNIAAYDELCMQYLEGMSADTE